MQSTVRRSASRMTALVLAAAIAGVARPAATATLPADPAAAIAAAAGHPAARHLRLERQRTGTAGPLVDRLDVEGMRRSLRTCAGDLCAGSWFDGKRRFEFGINGRTYPAGDPAGDAVAATFAAIVSTAFAEPDFLAAGGSVQRLSGEDERYMVRAPAGADLIAVADPATHELTAVDRPDGSRLTSLFAVGTPPDRTYASDRYATVAEIAEPLLAPVGPVLRLSKPAIIPLHGGPLPLVSCRLGGRLATCLIDTGTSPSAVSESFAQTLGATAVGTMSVAVLGTEVQSPVIEAGPLELGSAQLGRMRFAVVHPPASVDFDVIIGSDALGGISVALDPGRNELHLLPSPVRPADAAPLQFRNGIPYVQARLAGGDPLDSLVLDTGDTAAVTVGDARYRAEPGLFGTEEAKRAAGLAGIEREARGGTLAQFEVDGRTLTAVPALSVRGQNTGHLGFGIAAACGVLSFDLSAAWMRCGPREIPAAG